MSKNMKIYPSLLKRIIYEEKRKINLEKENNPEKYVMIERYVKLLNKIEKYQKRKNKKINEAKIAAIKKYLIKNISRRI